MSHYLQNKDPKKAVAAAQDALAALPDRPELLDALGRAQQAAGENSQANATYNKWGRLQPDSPQPFMRMAEMQMAAKDYDAALQSMRKALALKPDLIDAQRGIVALDAVTGRVPEAVAMAREMQKQKPKESVGFIMEGDVHASRNAWGEAVAAYRKGLKQVGTTDLAIRLDTALREAGGGSEADKFAATWLKQHAKDGEFRLYLAQGASKRKDYTSAIHHYKILLDIYPDNAILLNNLAWAAGQLKDPAALEYAEKANKLAPDEPAIMDTLGTLLVEQGDTTRGVELLQKASSLAPQAPDFRLDLAKGLIKAGRKEDAKKELDELAKLGDKYPAHGEVAHLMKNL